MPTGVSIFLIAAGAILYFAVTKVVDGLSLGAVGVILMIVGVLGLVVSLVVLGMSRTRVSRTTIVQGAVPAPAGATVQRESRPGNGSVGF
jgi:hypothetical protein